VIVGVEIDQIKSQINETWKFNDQLKVQMHKLKTNDQDENVAKL